MCAANLAPGFNFDVYDGIIPGRRHGRLGLGGCPPSFAPHDRSVVAIVPDGVLSRLRQLGDHARQKLQLVDPLHVLADVSRTLLITPALLGMPAACPVEHFTLLAVPFHPLEAHWRPGQVTGEPLKAVAVACLDHDLVVNREAARVPPAEDQLHSLGVDPSGGEQQTKHFVARRIFGMVKTHCACPTGSITSSRKNAPKITPRFAPHDGHNCRVRHEKVSSRSRWQESQRRRAKPNSGIPQSR